MNRSRIVVAATSALLLTTGICDGTAAPVDAVRSAARAAPVETPVPTRDLHVRDVVEMRQVAETQVSPGGEWTAVVVTEPSVATSEVTSRILVTDTATGRDTQTVVTETDESSRITNLRWSPDGESLTYVSARDGADEIWSVPRDGGDPERVVEDLPPAVMIGGREVPFDALIPPHRAKVLAFAWSPDGRYLAYTAPHLDKTDTSRGVVYDDETMSLFNLALSKFDTGTIRLRIRDMATGQTRRIDDLGTPPPSSLGVGGLAWSPDSETLAITRMTGRGSGTLAIALEAVDAESGELTTVTTQNVTSATAPVWSPDSRHVLGQRGSTLIGIPVDGGDPIDLATLPEDAAYLTGLWWSSDGHTLAATAVASREYVYVGERGTELEPVVRGGDDLSMCGFDADLAHGLCVWQDIGTPPSLATVDVAVGKLRAAEDINPQLRNVRVIQPQPTRWKNKYGSVASGYEIVPDRCRRRGDCPVVVITHGSDARNKFMDPGHEWNYPSQVFASRGYVVLLVNEARYHPNPEASWEERKINLGMDGVATFQKAVRRAVADGYADPDKAGIMGYSHGFQTGSLALAHTDTFHAASLANGSDGNATYWLVGRKSLREYWAPMYGGNPVDPRSRAHWQEIDPAMNTHQIDAPLLMQFNEHEGIIGLQQYSFLRDRGQPVELAIFPGDNHIFYQPRHRTAAMSQNLDWFDYWLRGHRDLAPAKAAQYDRWDRMKQRWRTTHTR